LSFRFFTVADFAFATFFTYHLARTRNCDSVAVSAEVLMAETPKLTSKDLAAPDQSGIGSGQTAVVD
jgi:hypothetical protein